MNRLTLLTLAFATMISSSAPMTAFAYGEELVGEVIGVVDGDSITVRAGRTVEKVRLLGIDCPEAFIFAPEKSQNLAEKATEFTSERVFGKKVIVYGILRDRLGRLLADVYLPGETKSLNEELVENGLAYWYERHPGQNAKLKELQADAQKKGLNIWDRNLNPAQQSPEEFRVKDRLELFDKWQARQREKRNRAKNSNHIKGEERIEPKLDDKTKNENGK